MSNCKTPGANLSSVERDPVFLSQKGVPGGVPTLDATGKIPLAQLPLSAISSEHDPIYESEKGQPFGCATLGGLGLVPTSQLGIGLADGTVVLFGDGTWRIPPAGGGGGVTKAYVDAGDAATLATAVADDAIVLAAAEAYSDAHDKYSPDRIVDVSGHGTDTTLASALAALSSTGGTIYVKAGTYSISATMTLPLQNITIIGAGGNVVGGFVDPSATVFNLGSNAISLFTTPLGGGGSTFASYRFVGFKVVGDGSTAGQTFLDVPTSALGSTSVCEFLRIDSVCNIVRTQGQDVDVTFRQCTLNPTTFNASLWNATAPGGELTWDHVQAQLPSGVSTSAITGGPTWNVTYSYLGGPSPSTINVQDINWVTFFCGKNSDRINITVHSSIATIASCQIQGSTLNVSTTLFFCTNSWVSGSKDGSSPQLTLNGVGGVGNISISNVIFDGSAGASRGLGVVNISDVNISGCQFTSHSSEGVSASGSSTLSITGSRFNETVPVRETATTVAGRYSNNSGFGGSVIIGLKSLVENENYRNIVTWGADPTGVADSTTAIQAAANSIPTDGLGTLGGELFMPPGKYKISSTITLPNMPLKIIGSGDGTVINIGSNAIAAFTIGTPPVGTGFPVIPEHEVVFEDFLVKGNSIAAQKIVNLNDSTSATIVRMVRVLSTAIQIPIFINSGNASLPVIVSADDCYFDQLTNNSSILISTSVGPGWTTFAYFNRVRFYHVFQDTHTGALTNGGDFVDFSNIDIIAEDSIFQIGTSCTMGSITMYSCAVYNGSGGANPTIHVEDDNDAEIFSQLTDCVGTFVNFDLNANGTVFNGGFYNGCIFTDNAISYFTDCLIKSAAVTTTITGSGNTQIKGCEFIVGTAPGMWIDGIVSSVVGCEFNGNNATAAIRQTNSSSRISDCRFNGTGVPFLENGSTENSRLDNNVMTVAPSLIAGSNTTINGVKKKWITGGTTTGAYITQFTHRNENGVVGIGTIKNTGVTNSLQVRETVTDAFGVTDNVVTTVAPSSDYMLDPQTNINTARPPYVSYAVAVQHPVAATTFDIRHATEGAEL